MAFPVDSNWIDEAENDLGVAFPPLYRAQLRKMNGGFTDLEGEFIQVHPVFDRSSRKRLSRTSRHVVLITREARENETFPQNGVVVATVETDHLFLLPDDSGELGPKLYRWFMRGGFVEPFHEDCGEFLEELPY